MKFHPFSKIGGKKEQVTQDVKVKANYEMFLGLPHKRKNDQPYTVSLYHEPPRGKINNVVSDQVRHKPTCTSIEKS